MNPLLAQFVEEANERLESAGRDLVTLEGHPNDEETLQGLFRSVHTLKGSSGLFDVEPLTTVLHAAEELLTQIRARELAICPELIDALLVGLDQVAVWVSELDQNGALPDQASPVARDLAGRLRSLGSVSGQRDDHSPPRAEPQAGVDWLDEVPEAARMDAFRALAEQSTPAVAIDYAPIEGCFFAGEDPFYLARQTQGLRWQSIDTRADGSRPVDEVFDPYQCNLRFRLLTGGPVQVYREHFCHVEAQTTIVELTPAVLAVPVGSPSQRDLDSMGRETRALVGNQDWTGLHQTVSGPQLLAEPESIEASALRWLALLLETRSPGAAPDLSLVGRLAHTVATGTVPPLETPTLGDAWPGKTSPSQSDEGTRSAAFDLLQFQHELLSTAGPCDLDEGRLASAATVITHVCQSVGMGDLAAALLSAHEVSLDTHDFAPVRQVAADALARLTAEAQEPTTAGLMPESERTQPDPQTTARVIKVDQTRIDSLMDLVGELVVAKNSLPFLARRAAEVYGVGELSRELKAHYAVINRVATDLHAAVMQVRMVPVSHIFQRFPRRVRDIARRVGKEVRLEIEGEQTEADKNIIDALGDPLLHIVRNAIDHGLESPEDRAKQGKPTQGVITLWASQLDDQVVIEVRDDGRGIDVEAVKRRALGRGLITQDQLESLDDDSGLGLVFLPGLSTTREISDLSGRGVGMDVVRTVISRLGGSTRISSHPGQGTCLRMSLPMTMAVTHVMMIEAAQHVFGVPIEAVVETVRVPYSELHAIKNHQAVVLRRRLVPVYHLRSMLDIPMLQATQRDRDALASILVVRVEGEEVGLVVDKLNEGVDLIVKPPEGVLSGFKTYSGTALLGDGRILLVLNLRELFECP